MKGRSGDTSYMDDMEKERQELVAAIKKERRKLQELPVQIHIIQTVRIKRI